MEATTYYIRYVISIVPIVFAFVTCMRLHRAFPPGYGPLCLVTAMALLVELLALPFIYSSNNNVGAYMVFGLLEYLLLLVMLAERRPQWDRLLIGAGVFGAAVWVADLYSAGSLSEILIWAVTINGSVMMALMLALLWRTSEEQEQAGWKTPFFWVLLGHALYFGCLMPLFFLTPLIAAQDPELASQAWSVMHVLMFLRYFLTGIACIMERRRMPVGT